MISCTNQFTYFLKFLTVSLFLTFSFVVSSDANQNSPGDKVVNISEKNRTIREILKIITDQTGLRFSYNTSDFNQNEKINTSFLDMSVEKVLKHVFAGRTMSWIYIDNVVRIGKGAKDQAPSMIPEGTPKSNKSDSVPLVDVTGQVVDAQGRAVISATVSLRGQGRGQGTDESGKFGFANIPANATLLISSVGFEAKQVKLSGQKHVQVRLDSLIRNIQTVEVVSTGYQILPKERATGSFNKIGNKLYNEQVGTNVLQRLPYIANSMIRLPGRLSSDNQITIRGLSTLNGPKEPLIILDNFPYEGDINNLNPNDVEDITILKDAAAASIWGARAGNGVIVITTKKGQFNRKTRLEFNYNITVAEKPDLFYLKNISSGDFIDVEKFLYTNSFYDAELQYAPMFYQTPVVDILEKETKGEISSAEATRQIDLLRNNDLRKSFKDYIYRNAVNQQFSIGLNGGSDNFAWILSAGMDRNIDNLDASFNRYNFRVDNVYKPTKNLTINAGVYFTQSKSQSGRSAYGTLLGSPGQPPYIALKNEAGDQLSVSNYYRQGFIDTAGQGKLLNWNYYPLEDYKHRISNDQIQDVIGKIGLKYALFKNLEIDVRYQYERQNTSNRLLNDEESFYTRDLINSFSQVDFVSGNVTRPIPLGGILDLSNNTLTSHNLRGQLNYNNNWGRNSVTAILGGEVRDLLNEGRITRNYGYNSDILTTVPVDYINIYPLYDPNFGAANIPDNNTFRNTRNRFVSVYANGAYTYDGKYTLSVSGRRDASNLFGVKTNDKWNPLWSAGFAWDISKESFFSDKVFDYLKLRTTYGFSGNVSPTMTSVSTIMYTGTSTFTSSPTARVNNFFNPELRWERVGMFNLGLDFRMKNNVFRGSIEYFIKNGLDLYGEAPIDRTLGLARTTIQKNVASLRGHGIDVELNSTNIDGAITWTTTLNLSYYKDKITKIYQPDLRAEYFVTGIVGAEGYPRYSIFTYKWAGLDPENGDPVGYVNGHTSKNYLAITGDSAKVTDLNFKGSALPTLYGSIGNTISYKKFTLTARLTYQFGYYLLKESVNYNNLFNNGEGHSDYAKRWKAKGDEKNTNVPSMRFDNDFYRDYFYNYSDALAIKGDHIRFQYLNISYDFTNHLFKKLSPYSIKVYFIANDLGIIWKANKDGIDPLYTKSQIPPAKSFTFGINANF